MNGRIVLSLVGLVVIVVAFFLIFEYPQYANEAFYLLLSWMVINFVLLYALRPRGPPRPTNQNPEASPFPSQAPANAPLPTGAPAPSGSIGFCIYCAAPIAPGTRACPACGHVLPQW
ncbi:MAG TPA: hypothetical protein VEG66_05005 [Thermoplasmata archaeon]|jgi:hypothetical protein|nr:hypothetical protein [Thermoplasmata archaeon]